MSELLPTGTVTLLLADVEGSTRLWEAQPDAMTVAFTRLDSLLAELLATHRGARPVERVGAHPAAHRYAHRRSAAAQRR